MIKPALHHVIIKASRLAEMVKWYGKVVGAEVTFMDADNAWTTNDGANHRVAFLSTPALTDDADKRSHNQGGMAFRDLQIAIRANQYAPERIPDIGLPV